jgi:hypothetical protein
MYIGLIYDVFSDDTYFAKDEDLNVVKELLLKSNLQLPTACIYDYSKNRFVLLNDSYRRHIEELLTAIEKNR